MEPGYFDSLGLDDDFGTKRWLTTRQEAWRLVADGEYECEPIRPISLESSLRRLTDRDNPTAGLLGLVLRTDLLGSDDAAARDDDHLLALVMRAVETGHLVVVRETGRPKDDPAVEARAEAHRIAREVNRLAKGDLRHGGSRYTLHARDQIDRAALGATRRMLFPREATTILEGMVGEYAAGGELAARLVEAKAFFVGDEAEDCELVLLRHLAEPSTRTVVQAPVTPSQIRKENAGWIEIELVDDRGEPLQRGLHIVLADGSARDVETDEAGFVRVEGIAPGITKTSAARGEVSSASQVPQSGSPSCPSDLPSLPSLSNQPDLPSHSDLPKLSDLAGLRDLPGLSALSKLEHLRSLPDVARAYAALNTALNMAGLPTLPELPHLPNLPNLPSVPALPALPDIARAYAALNTALDMAGLPSLPDLPNLPSRRSAPARPSLPNLSSSLNTALDMAGLPSLPDLPSLPSVPDLSTLSAASSALNTALNVAGLPSLLDIPNLPNLPSTPDLPSVAAALSVPDISSVAGLKKAASAAVVVGKAVDSLSAAAAILHGGSSSSSPPASVPVVPAPPLSPPGPKKET